MAEVREASSVVTSDNATTFYAERLGLADEQASTEAESVKEDSEPEGDVEQSEPEAKEEAKKQEPEKQKDKLNKRFDKVTKRAQEAEAKARDLEERLKSYEAGNIQKPQQETVKAEGKPQASQFNDAFEYAEALAEWSAEKALKDRDVADQQRRVEEERNKVVQTWNKKVSKIQEDIPDFNKVVSKSSVVVSDAVRDAIIESDVGPQILYHLASDNDLAESISKMPAIKALKEIGRLEARFEAKEEKPKKEAKTVSTSKAPAPINPLKGGKSAGADVLVDTNGEFYGSYAQWKAARLNNRIR